MYVCVCIGSSGTTVHIQIRCIVIVGKILFMTGEVICGQESGLYSLKPFTI